MEILWVWILGLFTKIFMLIPLLRFRLVKISTEAKDLLTCNPGSLI